MVMLAEVVGVVPLVDDDGTMVAVVLVGCCCLVVSTISAVFSTG